MFLPQALLRLYADPPGFNHHQALQPFKPQDKRIKDFRGKNKIKPSCFGNTRTMQSLGSYFRIINSSSATTAIRSRLTKASDQPMELSTGSGIEASK